MAYELCFRDVTKKNDVEAADRLPQIYYDIFQIQRKFEFRIYISLLTGNSCPRLSE